MLRIWQPTHRMMIRHDPLIGHRYVPNLRVRVPTEHGGVLVRTNAQGFRSDVDFEPRRRGWPRILVLGDSYAAGDGVANAERFPERLGALLRAEVYNYGLSGSGTDQQLLVLERLAAGVDADLVVLAVLAENIERNKVDHRLAVDRVTGSRVRVPKPYFTLDDAGRLVLHGVPVPVAHPAEGELDGTERFGSHRRDPRLGLVYEAVDRYRHSHRARSLLDPMMGRIRPLAVRAARFQPFPDYLDEGSLGWRLMRAILERAFEVAAPVPVLVVPLPTYHNLLDGVPPVFQARFESLSDLGRGIHVADVATPLQDLPRSERKRIPFETDVHFSPEGHGKIAALLAREVRARRLLPAPAPVGRRFHQPKPRGGRILGISGYYHDSAAALIDDGRIVAAAQEERFTRVKNDRRFPRQAIDFCLEAGGIEPKDLEAVVFYDNAALTFERLLHTQLAVAPGGAEAWQRFLPSWLSTKLKIPETIREALGYQGPVLQDLHHRSHAASAFYPSPFEDAAILTVDGVGEWSTATIGVGEGHRLELLREMRFPHSLGLLYSAFTAFTGFKVNSGEYKMMGLAPYGTPRYVDAILEHLVDLKDDGSVELNLDYFTFLDQPQMTGARFAELFGGPARPRDGWITEREMDLAASVQVVVEEAVQRMARHARRLTGKRRLCLAGGVALNCVANGKLLRSGIFDELWIQPAAGDAGGALGAALDVWHGYLGHGRVVQPRGLQGSSRLGPSYGDAEVDAFVESAGIPSYRLDPAARADTIAGLLTDGKIVGHFSGPIAFGPRALGGRSILGDPRSPEMQASLNLKIKYRESFRPFAPVVLEDRAAEYFDLDRPSPYMLLVAPVKEARRLPVDRRAGEPLTETVRRPRSDVPAVTHVDYSARIQTVRADDHPDLAAILTAFEARTGCPVLVNTSFNVRGEPIVLTPQDAYRCFMRTEMDVLVLGDRLLLKGDQPPWPEAKGQVEDEGPPSAPAVANGRLAKDLGRIFRHRLVPLAEALRARGEVKVDTRFHRAPSTWHPIAALDRERTFEIPAALAVPGASARSVARAITGAFGAGPAYPGLVDLVEALVTAGRQKAAAPEAEEPVPDLVYVMF